MNTPNRSMMFHQALAGILAALVLAGCRSDAAQQQGPTAPTSQVSVAGVARQEIHQWHEFPGGVDAVDTVEIRPSVAGYVDEVCYTENSKVKKGDVLFVIDQRPYRAGLARAEAELMRARGRLNIS